ncbi:protein maelstrom homolog [Cimex lectularius]|uniref:Maelstrom domain-containing protein n=1 Tax=Cimex lectularius TaxID=79782 RepID=A0A8I6RFS1_CIMLE|nr:protein maelstrom homolog [Cimex lectularius]
MPEFVSSRFSSQKAPKYKNLSDYGHDKGQNRYEKKKYKENKLAITTQKKEKQIQEEEYLMKKSIIYIVRRIPDEEALKNQLFYVCHINYFAQVSEDNFLPAEIAIAEFNLGEGLCATLQFFVNPGEIPLGMKYEVLDWAYKSHGIPVNVVESAEDDYPTILRELKRFLRRKNPKRTPPIYSMPDDANCNHCISAVRGTLSRFAKASNEDCNIRVFPLPMLFYELKSKCMELSGKTDPRVTPQYANNELVKDVYSHCRKIGCDFHEEKDLSQHCSLSTVKRWVFTISMSCAPDIGVVPNHRRHCPDKSENF